MAVAVRAVLGQQKEYRRLPNYQMHPGHVVSINDHRTRRG